MDGFEDHDLAVDFPAVADFDDENHELVVLNVSEDAVAPVVAEFGAFQSVT
jgi:hypothetical protein